MPEPSSSGAHAFRPGLRIIKTALAVLICLVIAWLRNSDYPILSPIAAIICMRPVMSDSLHASRDRMIATVFGAVFGVVFLYLADWLKFSENTLLMYILASLAMIPVMTFIVYMRQKDTLVLATIVFLLITVVNRSDTHPLYYAFHRVIETFIGIVVSLVVNWLPFLRNRHRKPPKSQ